MLLQFNPFAVAAGFASLGIVALLPVHEALHLDAADRPRPRLRLGRPHGLGGVVRLTGLAGIPPLCRRIAWVVGYDTIYALQDIEDDEIVGIKSSARFFGAEVRRGVAVCYGIAVVFIAAAFFLAGAGPVAFLGLAALSRPTSPGR